MKRAIQRERPVLPPRGSSSKRGFSLVEMMIVVLVGTLVVGGLYSVLWIGKNNWEINRDGIELQQNMRTAFEWMRKDLRQAGLSTISGVPANGSANTSITFQIPSTVTSGAVVWSSAVTYSRGGAGSSQLLRTVGGTSRVIAQNVSSLQFSRTAADPSVIAVTLQVQKNTPQHGLMTISRTTQAKARN
jgi:prepilin-type N-terminal cleavage/methylation domain-containing protein